MKRAMASMTRGWKIREKKNCKLIEIAKNIVHKQRENFPDVMVVSVSSLLRISKVKKKHDNSNSIHLFLHKYTCKSSRYRLFHSI